MNLFVDMNLSPLWIRFFECNGVDAVHWSSVGDPLQQIGTLWRRRAPTGMLFSPMILISAQFSP
jgi:hypothetical protein